MEDLDPSTQRYFCEIGRHPVLSREQERAVAAGLHKDTLTSFHTLIKSNLSFVVKVATQYRNMGLSLGDLLSEGNVGLVEAARRYDYRMGTKFITYAVWWIRKSILKALKAQSSQVYVPSYQAKEYGRICDVEKALSQKLGRRPERTEISDRLGERSDRVEQVLGSRVREISLDQRVGRDESNPLSNHLASYGYESAEKMILRNENSRLLRRALHSLSSKERKVLVGRFGLNGKDAMTLREVGQCISLSRERVRQLEISAKRKIRSFLRGHACSTPSRSSS